MMKRIALCLLALFLLLGGCAAPAAPAQGADATAQPKATAVPETTAPEATAVPETTAPEATAAPETAQPAADPSAQDLSGTYENDSYDTVTLSRAGGEYELTATLYRLTVIEHAAGTMDGERIVFQATDGTGNPLTLSFYRDGETFTLRVEESAWEPLPAGTEVKGLVRTADEAANADS